MTAGSWSAQRETSVESQHLRQYTSSPETGYIPASAAVHHAAAPASHTQPAVLNHTTTNNQQQQQQQQSFLAQLQSFTISPAPTVDAFTTYQEPLGVPQITQPNAHGQGSPTAAAAAAAATMFPNRSPSETEQVEAGLALANLGQANNNNSNNPGAEGQPRKNSKDATGPKRTKKEAAAKDMRKSCAECRRLKAKCDRVFPCSNCRRRGCALVCPDGDLSCMQGKRLVLASTEQLHDRIAQLESALFHANTTAGNEPHPLLAPQYLDGGFASIDVKAEQGENGGREGSSSSSDLARSSSQRIPIESLLLSDDMVATQAGEEWVSPNTTLYPNGSTSEIVVGPKTFDVNINRQSIADSLRKLLTYLPPKDEMRRRSERFFQQSGWYQQILRPDDYNRIYEPAVLAPTSTNPLSPHKLAIVFMVMTLDIFFDTTADEVDDVLVSKYWTATQQCFNTKHFGWTASVPGVQALALITMFVGFAWSGARESNFFWLRQLTTAIQQLGMHKEPHPSLSEDEANFRRRVFHEAFIYDCLYSMNHGQRTAIPAENIEVRYPDNLDPLSTKKYDYVHKIMNHAIEIGSRPDSLPTPPERLRELEEKMVDYDIVHLPYFHCPLMVGEKKMPERPCEDPGNIDVSSMTRTALSLVMYKSNLYMHRPTLRRLISRLRAEPDSPLSDWDRRVILTSFDTCRFIVRSSCFFARSQPRLARRTWTTWCQVFSAVISIAALSIWTGRHMEPAFVNQAVMELHDGIAMFAESGSERAVNLSSLIPMLQTMIVARYPFVLGPGASQAPPINTAKEDMLFALMGGTGAVYKALSAAETQSEGHLPSPVSSTGTRKASPSARPKKTSRPANGNKAAARGAKSVSPVATMNALPNGHQQPAQQQPVQQQPAQQQQHPPQWNPAAIGQQQQQHHVPQSSAPVQQSQPNFFLPQEHLPQEDITMQPSQLFDGQMNVQQQLHDQTQYQHHHHMHQQYLQTPQQQAAPLFPAPVYSIQPLPTSQVIPDLQLEDDLNPTELWARLQTFYEPTVWWGLGNGFEPAAVDAGVGAAMGEAPDPSGAPAQQQQSGQYGQGQSVLLF